MQTSKDEAIHATELEKEPAILPQKESISRRRIQIHPLRNPVFDPQSREALALELTKEWSEELYDR